MAVQKTTDRGGTVYFLQDAHGNNVSVKQSAPTFIGANPTITLAGVTLTRQNVIDLLPALTAFANSGVIA
jgi:hypothetical protein